MKWKAKEPKDLSLWHRWFAWHPVKVGTFWIWLETIERRGNMQYDFADSWFQWEYREI
jgi:hypothetical protein